MKNDNAITYECRPYKEAAVKKDDTTALGRRTHKRRWHARQWIQFIFFALTVAIGIQFSIFVYQVAGEDLVTVQRPPGVEGFLPIGALMGWKLFFSTRLWDPVHPAAMVILGAAALICLALRKSFCSWLCPVGSLSEWLWRWGRRLMGRNCQLPLWLDILLRGVKYLLLGFFIWVIFQMSAMAILEFLQSPYYKMSDVKMLHFFTRMSALTGGVLLFLTIASVFVQNFWCRYLCPYGALMGLLAWMSPTRIQRRAETCVDCGRCARACPNRLPVDRKQRIVSPECTGCMDCLRVCPVGHTLECRTGGAKDITWSSAGMGIAVVVLFVVSIYAAQVTGHWQSQVQIREFRHLLKNINAPNMTHPSVGGK